MALDSTYERIFPDVEVIDDETLAAEKAVNDEAQELALLFYKAQTSLVLFRETFLASPGDVGSAWFHHKWSDLLLRGEGNVVVEGFRESAKSSIVIRAHSLHHIVFPDRDAPYLVFILANAKTAQKRLEEIVETYMKSPELSGNLIAVVDYKPHLGYFEAIVSDGTEEFSVRLEAYGKGAAIRGMTWNDRRPSKVIIDDPQDMEDAESETILEKDWDWFLSEVTFLGKDTRIFLIGNNLGEKCIVQRAIKYADALNFQSLVVPICDGEGKPNWSERFGKEFIERERAAFEEMGKLDVWYRERMCACMAPTSQRFRREMFRYYKPELLKWREKMDVYITLDLAVGQTKRSDYTAICVVAVDDDNNWFVLDVIWGRFTPTETIDKIFNAVLTYQPVCVGFEMVAFQAAMAHFVEVEMSRRNLFFQIISLRSEQKKELRIDSLHPRFARGSIYFPEGGDWVETIEDQLTSFPRGLHDDLIDALAYMDQIAIPPSSWKGSGGDDFDMPIAGGM